MKSRYKTAMIVTGLLLAGLLLAGGGWFVFRPGATHPQDPSHPATNAALVAAEIVIPSGPVLRENFDGADWKDMPDGNWSFTAKSGVWRSGGAYAASSGGRAYSPPRYIGLNNAADYIELPVVDNPTQVVAWVRNADDKADAYVGLQLFDGYNWFTSGYVQNVSTPNYRQLVWDLKLGVPNLHQRMRFFFIPGVVVYIDDVAVYTASNPVPQNIKK